MYEVIEETERQRQASLDNAGLVCSDWARPRRAEQRNGKDYPQECLGYPQSEQTRDRPMGKERRVCRAAWANFFLMNSAAYFTMRSDCQA